MNGTISGDQFASNDYTDVGNFSSINKIGGQARLMSAVSLKPR